MIIHFNDKLNQSLDINVDDDSYRFRQIMGDHNLTINFCLPEYVEVPIGAHCIYEGRVYTLCKPENYQKSGERRYKYTLIFESEEVKSRKWMFRNTNDGKLKFSLTGKPIDFLEMFVANLNMRDPGWTVGRCIAGNEKCMSFSHEFCDAVGKRIADEYQTELEYDGKIVSLGRVEYNKANPLPLAYGKGNGFIPGTKRESEDVYPIDTLYVQGDTRNINYSVYAPDGTTHSDTLLLPLSQHIWHDGKYFYNYNAATVKWSVFDENNNTWGECAEPANVREYVTASDGQSLRRGDKETTDFESSVDCTDIYPSRVGTITEVIPVNGKDSDGNPFVYYDFVDNTIPQNLNYKECLIEGSEMTIIPQSGMLVGRELGVSYDHDKRRFAIVPCEQDGCMMPGDVYIPRKGDKYAVFGIQLPEAYLCDNATKTGASWDMFRYAVKYMFDNEEHKVTYTGELDGIYARENWADIAGKIVLGGCVRLDDPEFKDGVLVRITSIKEFINKQHKPKIELSNTTSSAGFMQRISKIKAEEVVAENNKKEVKAYAKRQLRDAKETMKMLEKAFDYFSASIQPVTVQTMQLLVGDESLQFEFVKSSGMNPDATFVVVFDEVKRVLNVLGGLPDNFCRLMHKTLGIKSISSSHAESEHRFWILEPFVSEYLGDENEDKAYYLYARCRKLGDTSMTDYDRFILRETPISFAGDGDYYHMLVGILNSEYGGTRSFTSLYGYTEILPGQVLTQRVVSSNGKNFMDFLNNAFRIGDDKCHLDWNASVANLLSIKNANLQIANVAGKTMVYFNGTNGSGQLAGGNITWDKEGNIKAKGGTFTDIIIHGSLRNPFVRETDSIVIGGKQSTHDNVVPIADGGGWITSGTLEWGVEQSGRRMCIANYKWGSQITEGKIYYSAPTGQYFYEDGITKKSIHLSRECVELIGYGTETQFYGWVVLNRINLGTNARYGRKVNALAQGIVSGYSSGASINCKTFDDSTLSVTRLGEGQYKVFFPSSWGLTVENYIVMMTGYGGGFMKASLFEQGTSYFIVDVSDDASRNDGSFMFQVINLNDWI